MKKIVYVLCSLFMLAACDGGNTTIDGHKYELRNGQAGAEININFDGSEKRFYGLSAVNRYFGSYKTDGDKITLGTAGSTMMAGPEKLMSAERNYLNFLSEVKTYRLDGNRLILSKASGESLVFEKVGRAE